MADYRVCVVHGWCGSRMGPLVEHLATRLDAAGYPSRVTMHSVWEQHTPPPPSDLVLQVVALFSAAETGCPVITIKSMLANPDDPETMSAILERVRADHPASSGLAESAPDADTAPAPCGTSVPHATG